MWQIGFWSSRRETASTHIQPASGITNCCTEINKLAKHSFCWAITNKLSQINRRCCAILPPKCQEQMESARFSGIPFRSELSLSCLRSGSTVRCGCVSADKFSPEITHIDLCSSSDEQQEFAVLQAKQTPHFLSNLQCL